MYSPSARSLLAILAICFATQAAFAQIGFDHEPIQYSSADVADPVARLQRSLDASQTKLEHEDAQGYLKSVLQALDVPVSSQVLVFSKTSFQQQKISPSSPRALYFNDDVYVGCVRYGDVLEFSSVDPQQGAVFYTLSQDPSDKPKFLRDGGNCLTCHASSRTHDVPGHLVRSVYPSASGLPNFGAGTFTTTQASPLSERWGGWYVTGTHGKQRHMGNVLARDRERPDFLDVEAGANRTELPELVNPEACLSPHSDIVALMVLEHQTEMHNLITLASYTARSALYQNASMNKILDRPAEFLSESTERRIRTAADDVVAHMLFADEIELTDPIRGTSNFAEEFAARGPFDSHGRSLRQFDLEKRMFKFPCSYLIYSASFEKLPPEVKGQIYRKLWEVLTGVNQDKKFARLSADDRQAILEILRETKKDLPGYWRAAK